MHPYHKLQYTFIIANMCIRLHNSKNIQYTSICFFLCQCKHEQRAGDSQLGKRGSEAEVKTFLTYLKCL